MNACCWGFVPVCREIDVRLHREEEFLDSGGMQLRQRKIFRRSKKGGVGAVFQGAVIHSGDFAVTVVQQEGFLSQQGGADGSMKAVGEDDVRLVKSMEEELRQESAAGGIHGRFVVQAGEVEGSVPLADTCRIQPGFRIGAQEKKRSFSLFVRIQAFSELAHVFLKGCVGECGLRDGGYGMPGIKGKGHVVRHQDVSFFVASGQVTVALLFPAEDGEAFVEEVDQGVAPVEGAGEDDDPTETGVA